MLFINRDNLVKVEGKMGGAKYREILEKNQHLRSGQRFTFQPTAKVNLECFETMNLNVLEWPTQSSDLIENLW